MVNIFLHDYLREKKNILLGCMDLLSITTVVFAITTKCNQQCSMCDYGIEGMVERSELSSDIIKKVLDLAICKRVRYIGITGGEPFCHPGLMDLSDIIFKKLPCVHMIISSNGTLTDEIVHYFEKKRNCNNTILELSLLGIGMHDQMARFPGSLTRIKKTLSDLRDHCKNIHVRIKFTITPDNYHDLPDVIRFCESGRTPLIIKLIENVKSHQNLISYGKNHDNPLFNFNDIQKHNVIQQLEEYKGTIIQNRTHMHDMIFYLKTGVIKRPCFVNQKSLFITHSGAVYFCRMYESIGDVEQLAALKSEELYAKRVDVNSALCESCISIFRSIM